MDRIAVSNVWKDIMGNEATWQEATTTGRFAGKTVIVTGAASGIGQATALRIAKEGGRVIAADISKERLDDLVAENAGLDPVPVAGNISTEETAAVAATGGRVDALANVSGIMANFAPIHKVDDELWDRVFRINVTALMRLTRAGSVVNFASEAGLRGSAAGAASITFLLSDLLVQRRQHERQRRYPLLRRPLVGAVKHLAQTQAEDARPPS